MTDEGRYWGIQLQDPSLGDVVRKCNEMAEEGWSLVDKESVYARSKGVLLVQLIFEKEAQLVHEPFIEEIELDFTRGTTDPGGDDILLREMRDATRAPQPVGDPLLDGGLTR